MIGIRAALIHDHFSAYQGVEDDHMNILCMGGRTVGPEVAWDLVQTYLRAEYSLNKSGKRAVLGPNPLFGDRHWRDLVLFHEYFHAETGRGCGASHQTGWSGLIAPILMAMQMKGVGFAPTGSSC